MDSGARETLFEYQLSMPQFPHLKNQNITTRLIIITLIPVSRYVCEDLNELTYVKYLKECLTHNTWKDLCRHAYTHTSSSCS